MPLLLLGLTILSFWPQVVQGKVLYWGDIGLYFTPMQVFLRDNLRAGRVPLWNPLILCGTPYVGNPQTWPLYPVTALLPFVSAPYFLNLTVALHIWLAGIGTYLFARQAFALGRLSALLAAVTFMFGGQLVSKEQFPNMVQAAAWLPWVLWMLDCLLRYRRMRDALGLGAILGLQLLAAHAQMTFLTLYLAVAYGLFVSRRERRKRDKSRPDPSFALLLLSGTVAAGLAMGQILPTLALFHDAARQKLSFTMVNRFYMPRSQLTNFILPRLHGHPFYGDWTGLGNFWETCCYVGWLPFALAVCGFLAAWRRQATWAARFWTMVFVVGLWMALGRSGMIYHAAYYVLPGFRNFHDPARCLLWACFALSLLAGYGWEQSAVFLPRPGQRALIGVTVILLAFADLAHFGRTLYPLANTTDLFPVSPVIAAVQADPAIQAHQARILAPGSGVWLRFTSYKDFRQNAPRYQTLRADTLTPNLTMPYGLAGAYGYEPVSLKNAEKTAGRADHAFDPAADPAAQANASDWAGALGVKFIVTCRVTPPEGKFPGLAPVLAEMTLPLRGQSSKSAAKTYLSRDLLWQPRAHLSGSRQTVPLTDEGPDQVSLNPMNASPASLVLADTQAAGWQARVDGQMTPITTTGGCLRRVSLAIPGAHSVVFSYRPNAYRLGLYVTLLTLSALVGWAVCVGGRNSGRLREDSDPAAQNRV